MSLSCEQRHAALVQSAAWIQAAIVREFPNQLVVSLQEASPPITPKSLTPVFYGSFDWHSAVHGHWALLRLLRTEPELDPTGSIAALLRQQMNATALAEEYQFLSASWRASFERPYGLAWLLQLDAEIASWTDHPLTNEAVQMLHTLAELAQARLTQWLPNLQFPIRTGEHSQTAFAMGLALDWAAIVGDVEFAALLQSTAIRFHLDDRSWPFQAEPGGHDFLSPGLAAADLMRRVLRPAEFAGWLWQAWQPSDVESLAPVLGGDVADGKLAHFAGLNFSRAWMLRGIRQHLLPEHTGHARFAALENDHLSAGCRILSSQHYSVTHWVGSFIVYALTSGPHLQR